MHGPGFSVLALVLATWIAVIAAVWDLRWRRIPNVLTIPAVVSGIALHGVQSGRGGLVSSLWGMAIGGGVLLVFYILGGMGAGDVKLMAGIGALVGARLIFPVLVFMGVAGGIMAMGKLIVRYSQVRATLAQVGGDRQPGGGPMKETMPYGVAIAAGTLISLILLVVAGRSF
jgi:prepilin peptidase CpaA